MTEHVNTKQKQKGPKARTMIRSKNPCLPSNKRHWTGPLQLANCPQKKIWLRFPAPEQMTSSLKHLTRVLRAADVRCFAHSRSLGIRASSYEEGSKNSGWSSFAFSAGALAAGGAASSCFWGFGEKKVNVSDRCCSSRLRIPGCRLFLNLMDFTEAELREGLF